MAKLTNEEILEIQELYKQLGVYSQVAKKLGRSAATVKKYVEMGTTIKREVKKDFTPFEGTVPHTSTILVPKTSAQWGLWSSLTQSEKEAIEQLKGEL